MKALAGKNQMSYGGDGGSFNSIQDTGGQQVVIKSGSKIDSIQIGNNKYGGGGGGTSASFKLPQDGKFTILRLCTNDDVVGYIKLVCDGVTYEAGRVTGDGDLSFGTGLTVSFAGFSSGSMIDMILFNTYY
ncbi:hypothetical protein ACUTSW_03640 [Serratia sp. TSA_198.1]|uniref:hypothetical protein n=1 Tax=Serratia sp. TSA_198.1 TaxID=3415664 RepID=UPI0040456512